MWAQMWVEVTCTSTAFVGAGVLECVGQSLTQRGEEIGQAAFEDGVPCCQGEDLAADFLPVMRLDGDFQLEPGGAPCHGSRIPILLRHLNVVHPHAWVMGRKAFAGPSFASLEVDG